MPSARPRWRGADMIHTAKAACRPACPSFLLGLLAHRRRLSTCSSLTLWTDRVSFGRGGRRRGRGAVCTAEVARSRHDPHSQSCVSSGVSFFFVGPFGTSTSTLYLFLSNSLDGSRVLRPRRQAARARCRLRGRGGEEPPKLRCCSRPTCPSFLLVFFVGSFG